VATIEIAQLLKKLGCPPEKCAAMASQLERRARMDAVRKRISYESALDYLIGLMAQGWAAQTQDKSLAVGKGPQSRLPGPKC
jgi:hypothetical protein